MSDAERGSPTVADDLVGMLDLLADTIVQALGFGVAAVNLARPDGSMQAVSVAGDDSARDMLLGTIESAQVWDDLLAMSEQWGRLRFADHRNEATRVGGLTWVPDLRPIEAADAWHPEDALFAPLVATDGTLLGILSVDCPRDGRIPDATTRSSLEAFAVSAALAIEHASLRKRAELSEELYRHLASHDQLTGVGNRSMLLTRLQHTLTERPEDRTLIAVVFVDLDGFKAVNDSLSHQTGDRVLQTAAQRIQQSVRRHDTVVRWGGDEFVVLLEQLPNEMAAEAIAQRIAAALAEPLDSIRPGLTVPASVGLALGRADDHVSTDELITRADAAMYSVKRRGRSGWAAFRAGSGGAPARQLEFPGQAASAPN